MPLFPQTGRIVSMIALTLFLIPLAHAAERDSPEQMLRGHTNLTEPQLPDSLKDPAPVFVIFDDGHGLRLDSKLRVSVAAWADGRVTSSTHPSGFGEPFVERRVDPELVNAALRRAEKLIESGRVLQQYGLAVPDASNRVMVVRGPEKWLQYQIASFMFPRLTADDTVTTAQVAAAIAKSRKVEGSGWPEQVWTLHRTHWHHVESCFDPVIADTPGSSL